MDLHFSHAALRSVAEEALAKKTGARGLRRIMVRIGLKQSLGMGLFTRVIITGGFAAGSYV